MEWLGLWIASVLVGTLLAAALSRTRWWVGTIACTALGPIGLLVIAVDVATYRSGTTA